MLLITNGVEGGVVCRCDFILAVRLSVFVSISV